MQTFDAGDYEGLPDEERANDELIELLSEEYQQALRDDDRERIDDDIAPRFWARFASYFNQYNVLWEDPERDAHPDHEPRDMLKGSSLGRVQAAWMDRVLRGDIELGDEMDEEPSEY
jgi:hypothetical protein